MAKGIITATRGPVTLIMVCDTLTGRIAAKIRAACPVGRMDMLIGVVVSMRPAANQNRRFT